MLDDLKVIHNRDKSDALGVAAKQWQQLKHDFSKVVLPEAEISNVVVAGMGGSGNAAKLVTHVYKLPVPFEVVQDYTLPEYVGSKTLVVVSSYSGNTEEEVAIITQAEARQANVVIITSGGKLGKIAKETKSPVYQLPTGMQPRMAVFYNFAALSQLLVSSGLLVPETMAELHEAADWLSTKVGSWLPDVPTAQNEAKQIAQECIGLAPVIYAGPLLGAVAYKWKINFNENAKNIAWTNQFPEFEHNEIEGWTGQTVDKPYRVITLRSSFDNDQMQKRFVLTDRLLSGRWPHPVEVSAKGDTRLRQVLWTTLLGDFVSLYTAMLNNIDPTPVPIMEKLKSELA